MQTTGKTLWVRYFCVFLASELADPERLEASLFSSFFWFAPELRTKVLVILLEPTQSQIMAVRRLCDASERRGNTLKGSDDVCLKVTARIWP